MLEPRFLQLVRRLSSDIPSDRLIQDPLRRLAYGADASFYHLVPKLVVRVRNESEVSSVVRTCSELDIPYTFRAAGTSLSGQAISDSVLIQVSRLWNGVRLGPEGLTASFQPAVLGAAANAALAPFHRKIGPDPASIDSAMIGGMAANNASGMCCGNVRDTYHTLASIRVVLGDGSVLETSSAESRHEFAAAHHELLYKLESLAHRAKDDAVLAARIRRKYKIKNTVGYSLNSLIDFTDPFDVLAHLMVGSEGTLGFISEITYYTVPDPAFHATGLLLFSDIRAACDACLLLSQTDVAAVELMDRESLRAVEKKPGIPDYFRALDEGAAALLVETTADSVPSLREKVAEIQEILSSTPTIGPVTFTEDKKESKQLWNVRKGLFPSLGYSRPAGSTIIIEDVGVLPSHLAGAATDLRSLVDKYGYRNAVIFGHALQGNLHFVFSPDFNRDDEVRKYEAFLGDVADLVAGKYEGSLKAEHGTGRNMAPFVEREWGAAAFELMKEIKRIFDPAGIMNPGVILNSDPRAHVKDLKKTPKSSPIIEKCTECGFCERTCPSRHLTLTPRQRIVAWREISRLTASGEDPKLLAGLRESYSYQGDQTCAVDGLCGMLCPLEIDTGKFIKEFRCESHSAVPRAAANFAARNVASLIGAGRMALRFASFAHSILGTPVMTRASNALSTFSGGRIPQWNPWLPKPASESSARPHPTVSETKNIRRVVYFPSCVSRLFGVSANGKYNDSQNLRIENLLRKAGYEAIYPRGLDRLCCGMAFASKGYGSQGNSTLHNLTDALSEASEAGQLPIVFDTSPCAHRLREGSLTLSPNLKVYDLTEFIIEHLSPRLHLRKLPRTVAVHVPCSAQKMELQNRLVALANSCAERVYVPDATPCCGFAGDRGFTHPELTASALVSLKRAVNPYCEAGYSTSRTCEIGLSAQSGISYQSIAYLVDEASEWLAVDF
jgi:D-lactate dehydrogenase